MNPLIEDLQQRDISVADWQYIWLKDHDAELSEWAKGYIAAKLEEISSCLSSHTEDFREEFVEAVQTASKRKSQRD